MKVTVYETYAEPAGQVGSFLSLASNGLRVLRTLGLLERVQAARFAVPRQRMWSGSGKLLGDVPRGRLSGDDLHSVTLMRGALVEVLRAEALAAGAEIITGERGVDVITRHDRLPPAIFESTTELHHPTHAPPRLGPRPPRRPHRAARRRRAPGRRGTGRLHGAGGRPLARRMRDVVMPLAVRFFYERATAWLYTYDCGELRALEPSDSPPVGRS
ncbi:hypothetical protein [Streptomyces boninensis]|uniref:hypothetical protein n=1 Tax=Streptomyces boninensis TaxID=2039455 RepID=UPI003B213937